MAGVTLKGMDELKRNTRHVAEVVLAEALEAAQDAAAQVVKDAIEAAAPVSKPGQRQHPSGNLKAHIIKVVAKAKGLTTTGIQKAVRRVLIGPSKKEAYYSYFLEMGWNWSKGKRRRQAYKNRLGGMTHSQSGKTEGTHRIPPHKWFPKSSEVEARAQAAGEAAFLAVIEAESHRTR
jgi:hypothetical protein